MKALYSSSSFVDILLEEVKCLSIPLKGLAPRFQHYSMFNYPINQNK